MTRRVIALTGVAGVGKSTLLNTLSTRLEFLPLQASALIRSARERSLERPVEHDGLRYADLDENQQLLIRGFEARLTSATGLVILDAHSVIERDDDFVRIDPAVFEAIGIRAMIVLTDDPAAILTRRDRDVGRQRPKKNVDALADLQRITHSHAEDICRTLKVPLHLVTPGDLDRAGDILRDVRDGKPE